MTIPETVIIISAISNSVIVLGAGIKVISKLASIDTKVDAMWEKFIGDGRGKI